MQQLIRTFSSCENMRYLHTPGTQEICICLCICVQWLQLSQKSAIFLPRKAQKNRSRHLACSGCTPTRTKQVSNNSSLKLTKEHVTSMRIWIHWQETMCLVISSSVFAIFLITVDLNFPALRAPWKLHSLQQHKERQSLAMELISRRIAFE